MTKFAIFNTVTKTYIAVEKTEYIYTRLPGHIRKFETFAEAGEYLLKTLAFHEDFRVRDHHEIVEVK